MDLYAHRWVAVRVVEMSQLVLYPMNKVLVEREVETHELLAEVNDEETLLMIESSRLQPTEVILASRDEVRASLDTYTEVLEVLNQIIFTRKDMLDE